jgi:hypothetical protein
MDILNSPDIMECLPKNLRQIVDIIFEFYELFGIKFNEVFWRPDKNILGLKQFLPRCLDVADISKLVHDLCKIFPIFSISDVISYPDKTLGIIIRSYGEGEVLGKLPIELYTQIFKHLNLNELCELGHINKYFAKLCYSDELYRQLVLIECGGDAPVNECYDYREIHWQLLSTGGMDHLFKEMLFGLRGRCEMSEYLVSRIRSNTILTIYLFNNNKNFRNVVFKDIIKSSYMLLCLVIQGNLSEASSLVEIIRGSDLEVYIFQFFMTYNISKHNYNCIDFFFKYYPDKLNDTFVLYESIFIPKEKIVSFLLDDRITKENKDENLMSRVDFKVIEIINYVKLYRTIDIEFLLNYFGKVHHDEKRIDLVTYMLDNHKNDLTLENIKEFIRSIPDGHGNVSEISIQMLFLLCNTDVMKQTFK